MPGHGPSRGDHPHWTPNLRGVIRVEDGAEILISLHGQGVQERTSTGVGLANLTRVELLSAHEKYRWLNTSFIVGEGEIDEETEEWWVQPWDSGRPSARELPRDSTFPTATSW
jgi:hypothetical protein